MILDAILAGDIDSAGALVRQHIVGAVKSLRWDDVG